MKRKISKALKKRQNEFPAIEQVRLATDSSSGTTALTSAASGLGQDASPPGLSFLVCKMGIATLLPRAAVSRSLCGKHSRYHLAHSRPSINQRQVRWGNQAAGDGAHKTCRESSLPSGHLGALRARPAGRQALRFQP